jgi:hypothetical protein
MCIIKEKKNRESNHVHYKTGTIRFSNVVLSIITADFFLHNQNQLNGILSKDKRLEEQMQRVYLFIIRW